ncbi:SDR family NAD(P)-dependent oxidoreductase [Sphingomonas psychrolutea]|uniref:3-oxoacyl-ACP reductase n=1 Tax=Sphingomonas psychrolutea TaxID=1259676 RepID=A0ABQ1G530_9SPHN|nr:SDR family oxidoreductase [Sphingomonas psychrolutea]GGA36607.1 3-oxoacyl-ACP reductase [Sphingomonas psychrolutea]
MNRFQDKVAIVTGGSNGIGAAIVARLVAEGAKVMIADLAPPATMGAAVRFVRTDVSIADDVHATVTATLDAWGRLDVLVNNAGIGALAETPDMAEELWDRVFAVNIRSVYLFCRAAIPAMRGQGGAIVNIASISGLGGDYGMGAYNASKGAVINYTRSLALDCARYGIRVNALCPGLIETAIIGATLATEEGRAAWLTPIPLGRPGTPQEMASVVAFLASDDAAYMTGSILTADGGVTAHTGQPNIPLRQRLRDART